MLNRFTALDTLQVRRRRWDFSRDDPTDFVAGRPVTCASLAATSMVIPAFESFMIRASRMFAKDPRLPARLRAQLGGFMGQEAEHSRVHRQWNQHLQSVGWDHPDLRTAAGAATDALLALPDVEVAACVDLGESFTSSIACEVLREVVAYHADGRPILPNASLQMWYWHAIEEVEHADIWSEVLAILLPDARDRRAAKQQALARMRDSGVRLQVEAMRRNLRTVAPYAPALWVSGALVARMATSGVTRWKQLRRHVRGDGVNSDAYPHLDHPIHYPTLTALFP